MNKLWTNLLSITRPAVLTSIIVVQEYLLIALPSIQLTMLLVILYAKNLPYKQVILILIAYSLVDSILFGGLGPWTVTVGIGWLLVSLFYRVFPIESETEIVLCLPVAIVLWATPNTLYSVFLLDIPIQVYLVADAPFLIVMLASSGFSVVWLYQKLKEILILGSEN